MHIQLIRHATLVVTINGLKLLVDPMFGDVGVNPPIQNSANDRRNPLVPLPIPARELTNVDATLITHTHRDHFDEAAAELLPSDLPVICQPEDVEKLSQTFTHVHPVAQSFTWNGITIHRTGGQHGTGDIGKAMGPVSGYVLQAEGEPTLYIAGDTIWCSDVAAALDTYHPDITLVNAGGARFKTGDPIVMTAADLISVVSAAPTTQLIAVHMDSINHCLQTREITKALLQEAGMLEKVLIPEDGEGLEFKAHAK